MSHRPQVATTLAGSVLAFGLIIGVEPAQAQESAPKAKSMTAFRICLAAAKPGLECGQAIYDTCQADHDQPDTTLSIVECTMQTHKAWDVILNERYRALIASSPPELKLSLQRAQRAWITSRDADCAAVYEANKAGTIRGPLYASCLVDRASARVRWLTEMSGY